MKKKLLMTLLVLTLALAVPMQALAANAPVYLEGEQVATALERGGSTFLPLRTMFETVNATVDWDEAQQKITATLADGSRMIMQIGSPEATLLRAGGGEMGYQVEPQAFVQNGVTYVPLRFVTDTVLSMELDWRDDAVYLAYPKLTYQQGGEVYSFNPANGELTLNGQKLGVCRVPYDNNVDIVYNQLKVSKTAAGGWLLDLQGIVRGALTSSMHTNAWLSADGQQSAAALANSLRPELEPAAYVWQLDGQIWLNGNNELVQIDEAAGKVQRHNLGQWLSSVLPGQEAAVCCWQDGHFAVLGSGSTFVVYDMQAGVGRAAPLLTEEMKAQVLPLLKDSLTENFTADNYWANFGNVQALNIQDPVPYAEFVGAENGVLQFDVKCTYYDFSQEPNYQTKAFPVKIVIEELIK